MKFLFSIACMLLSVISFGQLLQDINGRPYLANSYEAYEGSALLFKDWTPATIITADGKKYDTMLVNIDLHQGNLLFLRGTEVFSFAENITEIHAIDEQVKKVFKKGTSIDPSMDNGFYQVLNDNPVILKKYSKKVADVPGYGASVKQYKFVDGKVYYARIDDKVQRISLNKGDAEKVFKKSWKQTEDFAAKNKISYKTEEGWVTLSQNFSSLTNASH